MYNQPSHYFLKDKCHNILIEMKLSLAFSCLFSKNKPIQSNAISQFFKEKDNLEVWLCYNLNVCYQKCKPEIYANAFWRGKSGRSFGWCPHHGMKDPVRKGRPEPACRFYLPFDPFHHLTTQPLSHASTIFVDFLQNCEVNKLIFFTDHCLCSYSIMTD